jgi:hypothetical protein
MHRCTHDDSTCENDQFYTQMCVNCCRKHFRLEIVHTRNGLRLIIFRRMYIHLLNKPSAAPSLPPAPASLGCCFEPTTTPPPPPFWLAARPPAAVPCERDAVEGTPFPKEPLTTTGLRRTSPSLCCCPTPPCTGFESPGICFDADEFIGVPPASLDGVPPPAAPLKAVAAVGLLLVVTFDCAPTPLGGDSFIAVPAVGIDDVAATLGGGGVVGRGGMSSAAFA